jgi:hypothetical protein
MTCGRKSEEKTISCEACMPSEDYMDSIPTFKSLEDKVADKLKSHFGVEVYETYSSEESEKFVQDLISEIIREDQISRMGALVDWLKIPEVKEDKKDE